MRCNEDFYRKSGRHVSNDTNMCDDIYAATILFGSAGRYAEVPKQKLKRIEMGPIEIKIKKSLVVASWA
jgi:hypothetical protein